MRPGTIVTPNRLHLHAAAVVAWVILAALPAHAQNYPRLAHYGSVYGDGYPLWVPPDGPLDLVAMDQIARHHEVILDASPITPYRPDLTAALRQRRPDIKLLAYVTGHYIWNASGADANTHYPTRYRLMVQRLDGFLYNRQGSEFGSLTWNFGNVNLAKRNAQGRYIVADSLAWLFWDAIARTGQWEGLFFDTYCDNITWMESPTESIDYQRAGYATRAEFSSAFKAGTDTLASRLRNYVGPNFLLVGNCGQSSKYAWFNGWMRENFPAQNGGTWYENMFRDPGGYFIDEARHLQPTHNYIFSSETGTNQPYTANNMRKVRFGLGSAALGTGYAVFGPSTRQSRPYTYHHWWYDEYAVNLTTGTSSPSILHTGWLGQPLGPYYQMIWVGTGPDAVTNPGFETNLSGWSFSSSIGGTWNRDVVNPAVGAASAVVHVPSGASFDWQVALGTIGTLDVNASQLYSATFWAKASTPRSFTVVAGIPAGGNRAARSVSVGTTWQQYQVSLVMSSTGPTVLGFYLGATAGDIWFDDVHFQAGATTIYRRDFQNGTVLVNPANTPLTVPLGSGYRRILGLADLAINNGQQASQATVGASDALFLLNSDVTPPARVLDLRVAP